MPKIQNIPEIKGISEARKSLPDMVGAVHEGQVFVIKSPRGKALLVGVDEFKELQEAYLDLESRLESVRMLENEGMREALAASVEDEEEAPRPLSQVRSWSLSDRHLLEESTEEELKEELVANMNAATSAAVAAGHLTEEQKEELLATMTEAADQLVMAAASAAAVAAAAKAAEEVAGGVVEGASEETAKRAAEEAAGLSAERFLIGH